MASLQEQFFKAGLVDKNKLKQASHDKTKQKKVERRTGTQSVDEVRLAALETQRKNAERARELNAQRDAASTQKAIVAQIAQMVEKNRQPLAIVDRLFAMLATFLWRAPLPGPETLNSE